MSQPPGRVSVVIPAFDAEAYLVEAIRSALAQGPMLGEVLVVDDGSQDRTAELAEGLGPPVRCLRQAHAGIGAARNRGVEAAQGELLAFLDADDLWTANKLSRQMAVLDENPAVDLCIGQVEEFLSPELDEATRARLVLKPGPLPGYLAGALLIRRPAFWRVGPFDPTLRVGETVAWFARASELGMTPWVLPEVVLRRRVHGANHTLRQRQAQGDYVKLAKGWLDRKRLGRAGGGSTDGAQ